MKYMKKQTRMKKMPISFPSFTTSFKRKIAPDLRKWGQSLTREEREYINEKTLKKIKKGLKPEIFKKVGKFLKNLRK